MNTWAEAMKAIGALEDRVSELEHVVAFGQRNDSASLTHDGRIVVSANEWDQYQRLRKAVLGIVPLFDSMKLDSERDFDAVQAVFDAMRG